MAAFRKRAARRRESYDHWVRNEAEWGRIARYIENNPVAAPMKEAPGLRAGISHGEGRRRDSERSATGAAVAGKVLPRLVRIAVVAGNGLGLNGLAGGAKAPRCAARSHLWRLPLVVRLAQDPLK